MLNIVILEDDSNQRQHLASIIDARCQINPTPRQYDAAITLTTKVPTDVIAYTKNHAQVPTLYFLDIDLGDSKYNGVDVGSIIRNQSCELAMIVFVTTHAEMLPLTMRRRVEPLDFIFKDDASAKFITRVRETLDVAYQRYLHHMQPAKTPYFRYQVAPGVFKQLAFADLIYIKSIPNASRQLQIIACNQRALVAGNLKDYATTYPQLLRISRQILVNPKNIAAFSHKNHTVTLSNGETIQVSLRHIKEISATLAKYQKN